jgi:phosphoglycolate phosphatase
MCAMKYRQMIWDWNGTLWNDTWLCVEINNHMLGRRGLPLITAETYRAKLCFPVTDYYCQLGFDYNADPYPQLAEEFIEEYHRRRFECDLHPEARELIEFFQGLELPQAVLSAYEQKALLEATDYFKLTRFFDDIIGLNDIYAHGKVENGKQYIAQLDIDPAEVLFIGDTLHDFEVAEAMGVRCALVANGHNSRERLEACGMPVFDSLAELRKLVFLK